MKKYELTQNSIEFDNRTLYQIRAFKDFGSVKKGDLGGYIEFEKNLSHNGNCWVSENAWVYGKARIFGDAQVYGKARVFEDAQVYGDAQVFRNAQVSGNARVYGNVQVFENARIYGDAQVYDNAYVFGSAQVSGNVHVSGNAHVSGNVQVFENAHVYGDAHLGNVLIDFDCSFDPYKTLKEILNYPEILPVLSGLNKNLDKLISTILIKTGT